MISVFNENTPTLLYSWGVLTLLAIVLIAIVLNLRTLKKKINEDFDETIVKKDHVSAISKSPLNRLEFLQHIALVGLFALVMFYGHVEKVSDNEATVVSMVNTIEKNNKVSSLTVLDEDSTKILCNDNYENSFSVAIWETEAGKQKAGLLVGQKDTHSDTCRFALKETK